MGLADARRSKQQHVFAVGNPGLAGELTSLLGIDRRLWRPPVASPKSPLARMSQLSTSLHIAARQICAGIGRNGSTADVRHSNHDVRSSQKRTLRGSIRAEPPPYADVRVLRETIKRNPAVNSKSSVSLFGAVERGAKPTRYQLLTVRCGQIRPFDPQNILLIAPAPSAQPTYDRWTWTRYRWRTATAGLRVFLL